MDPIIGQLMLFAGNFAPRGWAFCNGQLLSIAQNSALFSLLGTTYGGDGRNTFGLPDLRGRVPIGMGQGPGFANIQQGEMAGSPTVTLTAAQMPQHNHAVTLTGAQVSINTTVTGTIKAGATASGNFPEKTVPVTGGEVTIPVTSSNRSINESEPSKGVLSPTAENAYSSGDDGSHYNKNGTLINAVAKIPQTTLNLPVSGSVNVPIQTTAPVTGTASTAFAGGNSPVNTMSPYLGMNYCIALQGIYPSRD
jgi:microcystin-dependent protein